MLSHHISEEEGTIKSALIQWPSWRTVLISPLLYGIAIPMIVFDLCLEVYHRLAFHLLGIPLVPRREYFRIDRHRLTFLPFILKLACVYCGYANGLVHYAVRIAGDTETYFCPIKHQPTPSFHPPLHHRYFSEYGDATGFQRRFDKGSSTPVTRKP